jgi:hypothetical protein
MRAFNRGQVVDVTLDSAKIRTRMMMGRGEPGRVLVAVMAETRAWEITAQGLVENVLDPLGADLALCVGDHEDPNPLYERAKFIWRAEEPDDWGELYDRKAGGPGWRTLLEPGAQLLGPIEPEDGSGAIVQYYRQFLRESIRDRRRLRLARRNALGPALADPSSEHSIPVGPPPLRARRRGVWGHRRPASDRAAPVPEAVPRGPRPDLLRSGSAQARARSHQRGSGLAGPEPRAIPGRAPQGPRPGATRPVPALRPLRRAGARGFDTLEPRVLRRGARGLHQIPDRAGAIPHRSAVRVGAGVVGALPRAPSGRPTAPAAPCRLPRARTVRTALPSECGPPQGRAKAPRFPTEAAPAPPSRGRPARPGAAAHSVRAGAARRADPAHPQAR